MIMRIAVMPLAILASITLSAKGAEACPEMPIASNVIKGADDYLAEPGMSLGADGVLLFDYGSYYNNLGKYPNPLFIANYTLSLYRSWVKGGCVDPALVKQIVTQADWYVKNVKWRGDAAVWTYEFPNTYFGLEPGWISAISQSKVASALLRANAVQPNKEYLRLAEAAIHPYFETTAKGGVQSVDGDGVWLEEAPDPTGAVIGILNGHLTALEGLMDLRHYFPSKKLDDTIDAAIRVLKHRLPDFDAGATSYYSLNAAKGFRRYLAARGDYNRQHVDQLNWLYSVTNDPFFREWSARFESYEHRAEKMTAARSINAETNGPDKATLRMGTEYWSSAVPTWIQATYPHDNLFVGVHVGAELEAAAPKVFSIEATSAAGGKSIVYHTNDGRPMLDQVIYFNVPVRAVALRLIIQSTNGHEIVALSSFSPIKAWVDRFSVRTSPD